MAEDKKITPGKDNANKPAPAPMADGPSAAMMALFKSPDQLAHYDKAQWEKLTLPPFIRPEDFPIGAILEGRVDKIIGDFTNNPEMKDCQNLWMIGQDGTEFLVPVTGVIGQAILKIPGAAQGIIGKTLAIKRGVDSVSKKFKNRMFTFDVYVKRTEIGKV